MCTQQAPYNWGENLYRRHGETIEHYLTNTVVPSLHEKKGVSSETLLLQELQQRWTNHVIMNKWLQKFFTYLDRYVCQYNARRRRTRCFC